jgi:hypothetical protein
MSQEIIEYLKTIGPIDNAEVAASLAHVLGLPLLDPRERTNSYSVRNPEKIDAALGRANLHIIETELAVPETVKEIKTIIPDDQRPPHYDAYLDNGWGPQEPRHGQMMLLFHTEKLGLPLPNYRIRELPKPFKVVGKIAEWGPFMGRVLQFEVNMISAAHEQETITMYNRYAKCLRNLGEHEVARELILPIVRQEGPHGRFGKAKSAELWQQMGVTERGLARTLFAYSFDLVGVHDRRQKLNVGALINSLLDEAENPSGLLDATQRLVIRSMPRGRRLQTVRDALQPILPQKLLNCVTERLEESSQLDKDNQKLL